MPYALIFLIAALVLFMEGRRSGATSATHAMPRAIWRDRAPFT